jgi:hypothetical protein
MSLRNDSTHQSDSTVSTQKTTWIPRHYTQNVSHRRHVVTLNTATVYALTQSFLAIVKGRQTCMLWHVLLVAELCCSSESPVRQQNDSKNAVWDVLQRANWVTCDRRCSESILMNRSAVTGNWQAVIKCDYHYRIWNISVWHIHNEVLQKRAYKLCRACLCIRLGVIPGKSLTGISRI